MTLDARLSIRPNDDDLEALATIATHLRVSGQEPFATRSDAMRFALRTTVGAIGAGKTTQNGRTGNV